MKPTRNQLLAACDFICLDVSDAELAQDYLTELSCLSTTDLLRVTRELTSYSGLRLAVGIKPRSEAEQSHSHWPNLQVPIEPFADNYNKVLALAWCLNEKRACELVPYDGSPNLLVQAVRAQLHINRFEDSGRKSDPTYHEDGILKCAAMPIMVLDRGSVLLAFELAGLPAPKSYDDWRLPDGDNVPLTATNSDASLGTMTVHYTNGELALVTSGDGMRAKVVHVKSLRSSAAEIVRGLSGRAGGATARESKAQLKQEEAKSLASKFCNKIKAEVAA